MITTLQYIMSEPKTLFLHSGGSGWQRYLNLKATESSLYSPFRNAALDSEPIGPQSGVGGEGEGPGAGVNRFKLRTVVSHGLGQVRTL